MAVGNYCFTLVFILLFANPLLEGIVSSHSNENNEDGNQLVMPAESANHAQIIGEAIASEFGRHVPTFTSSLRNEIGGIRNDISNQFESLKHFMDDKLDRMERDAPNPSHSIRGSHLTAGQSPEAMIRHNLAMAELRRLGADLTKAMNAEVSNLREEFRTSLDLLREQVANSTKSMSSRLEGEFTVRSEESVGMLRKVFYLTRSQMALIQSQLNNISSALVIPELKNIVNGSKQTTTVRSTGVVNTTERNVTSGSTEAQQISSTTTTITKTTTGLPTTSTTELPEDLPRDCMEALLKGETTSGVILIKPSVKSDAKRVWCDQKTDGGGWTVILKREPQEIQLDFRRTWPKYREGFGTPEQEHWIGLETMHVLTEEEPYQLRVDMRWEEEDATSLYQYFSVGPERYGTKGYELEVGGYNTSSTGGDALEYHNGMEFSTYDEDNDGASGGSCSEWCGGGGWWYNYCFFSNPTGVYAPKDLPTNTQADHYLEWRKWQGYYTYLSHFVMMIRPNK